MTVRWLALLVMTLVAATMFATLPPAAPGQAPRSRRPARVFDCLDLTSAPQGERLALYALQGLVNRRRPRVWVANTRYEHTPVPDDWRPALEAEGITFNPVADPWTLAAKYRREIRGAILYDEALWTDPGRRVGLCLLPTLAGIHDALPLTPALNARLGLPVALDTRPIFTDTAAIYHYAEREVLPRASRDAIHHGPPGVWLENTDYLVAHRIFSFFQTAELPEGERAIYDRFLAHTRPVTPVLGVWAQDDRCPPPHGYLDETHFVGWLSAQAKYMIVTHTAGNLTVHTGLRAGKLRQARRPAPPLDRSKIYVTFILSDGDNLAGAMQLRPRLWRGEGSGEGREIESGPGIAAGWNWGASLADLCPVAAKHYYTTMTPAECHVAACTGYGYILPGQFGEAFDPKIRAKYWNQYLDLTARAMRRMDMRVIWPWWTDWPVADTMAGRMAPKMKGGLTAIYLDAFPRQGEPLADQFRYLAGGKPGSKWAKDAIPAFWNLGQAAGWDEAGLTQAALKARDAWPSARPAFLFFGLNGFQVGYPQLKKIMDALGPDAVSVTPEQFAELYRQARPASGTGVINGVKPQH